MKRMLIICDYAGLTPFIRTKSAVLRSKTIPMIKLLRVFIFVIPLAFLVTGCPYSEGDSIYNHSGQKAIVCLGVWGTNASQRLPMDKGQWVGFIPTGRFEIRRDRETWSYNSKPSVWDFRKKDGGKKLPKFYTEVNSATVVVSMQVEPDGKIYLLLPGSTVPVTNFPPQPNGFPLEPQPSDR
jgi:hypothetical protein